ncbi:MAG TPA: D-glycerate dehydrogenase [Solirubrobacterales bacterium]|jgi:glyoxylate reductase|nr:D-glycerate dehydrogenase [Solirubrobacterales bacterium]
MGTDASARFVVTGRVPDSGLELLRSAGTVEVADVEGALPRGELLRLVAGTDAVLTLLHDRVDDELLEAAGPGLRCVANVAVGYDNVDLEAAARRGVAVANTPGVLDDATADLTMALILAAARRLGEAERLVRSGEPWAWGMGFMLGRDLRGKRLGIVGLGAIGRRVAERARAFGMRIAYSGRHDADPAVVAQLEAKRLDLDELLASADVLSLHCPLSAETHHLIAAPQLALMKPEAILVNAARGQVVDEAALAEALREGRIAAAALDVYEHEPRVHPGLLGLENVTLIPHLGSATVETRRAMAELAARNAIAAVRGEPLPTPVALPD